MFLFVFKKCIEGARVLKKLKLILLQNDTRKTLLTMPIHCLSSCHADTFLYATCSPWGHLDLLNSSTGVDIEYTMAA